MHASNIIFSNGALDPWRAGGVLTDINEDILVTLIPHSAHHLDLREPNEADPKELTDARTAFATLMQKWIDDWKKSPSNQRQSVEIIQ